MNKIPLILCCVLAVLLTVIFKYALFRYGIFITPDGWAYWQGSVSLLNGNGYRYFYGPNINGWPPLYSIYLAMWQFCFGISGHTLVLANTLLVSVAVFGWCAIFVFPLQKSMHLKTLNASITLFLIMLYISSYLSINLNCLLAHNLYYAIMPMAFYLCYCLCLCKKTERTHFLFFAFLTGIINFLLCQTHNTGFTVSLATVIVLLLMTEQSNFILGIGLFLATVLPLIGSYITRDLMGQMHSHIVGLHVATQSPLQYLGDGLFGIANLISPTRLFGSGYFILMLFSIVISILLRRNVKNLQESPIYLAIKCYLLLSTVILIELYITISLTFTVMGFESRYLIYFTLVIVSAVIILYRYENSLSQPDNFTLGTVQNSSLNFDFKLIISILIHSIFILVIAIEFYRITTCIANRNFSQISVDSIDRNDKSLYGFVHNRYQIDPTFINRKPEIHKDYILIAPPYHPWIHYMALHPHAKTDTYFYLKKLHDDDRNEKNNLSNKR